MRVKLFAVAALASTLTAGSNFGTSAGGVATAYHAGAAATGTTKVEDLRSPEFPEDATGVVGSLCQLLISQRGARVAYSWEVTILGGATPPPTGSFAFRLGRVGGSSLVTSSKPAGRGAVRVAASAEPLVAHVEYRVAVRISSYRPCSRDVRLARPPG